MSTPAKNARQTKLPNHGTVFGLVSVTVPTAFKDHFKDQPFSAVAETLREAVYDLCAANGMSRDLAVLCFEQNLELGLYMKPVHVPDVLRQDIAERVVELLPQFTGGGKSEAEAHIQEWLELQKAFDSEKAKRRETALKPTRSTRSASQKQKGATPKKASEKGGSVDDQDGGTDVDEDEVSDVVPGGGGGEEGEDTLDLTSIFNRLQGGSSVIEVATFDDSISPEAKRIIKAVSAHNSYLSVLVQSFFSHCKDPIVQSTVAEVLGAKAKVRNQQMTSVELMCGVYNQARHLLDAVIAALSRGTGDGGRILALEEQIGAQAPRGSGTVAVTMFNKHFNDAVTAHARAGGEEKAKNVLTALYLKCLVRGGQHAAAAGARVKEKYDDTARDAGKDSTKSALSLVEVQDLAAVLYAEELKKSPESNGGGGKGNEKK